MDYLLLSTLEVFAIADWQWQTRLNNLLVRTVSLVHTSRVASVDLRTLVDHWHKCWWNAFQATLRRQSMQEEYIEAHLPASGQPSWQVLLTPQFHSCRLLQCHLTALYVRHRDYDRLVELWRHHG